MNGLLLFGALGIGGGAVYALLALGMILTYRASGVINFAQGAMSMFLAYVYVELLTNGDLVFPVIGVPDRVQLTQGGMTLWLAAAVTVAYGAALGGLLYVGIFRLLRGTPVLARVAAAVGVMLALQSLAVLKFGTNPRSADSPFPTSVVNFGGVAIPGDRLLTAGVAITVTGALWALFRYSRFGVATRAAAESESGALLLGLSPTRLAAVNWAISSALAAFGAILILPISALDASTSLALIVPALGAAVVARFTSFSIAVAAAFGIGILQSESTQLQVHMDWVSVQGLESAAPFLVIIVAMTVSGNTFPRRGELESEPLPDAPVARKVSLTAFVGLIVGAAGLFALTGPFRGALIQSFIMSIIALSVVILTGFVGQISLAQITFAGIGGYVVSRLADGLGMPFPLSVFCAALVAVPIGIAIGLPAVRVRGVNLAVVTLGSAVAIDQLFFANPNFFGPDGSNVPSLRFFGIDLDISSERIGDYPRAGFGLVTLVVLIVVAVGVANLRRSRMGRRMIAVRDNEAGATAAGVDVAATKLLAFAMSALVAGIGGALIGYQQHILTGDSFALFMSLEMVVLVYIAGITRISGAIVAGLLLADGGLVPYSLDRLIGFGQYQLLFAGCAVIATAIFERDGIAGGLQHRLQRLAGSVAAAVRPSATVSRPRLPAAEGTDVQPGVSRDDVRPSASLRVAELSVAYGWVDVVRAVSFEVRPGEVVGFIGPNGAGKSTMVDGVTGFCPARGSVTLGGRRIDGLPPHRRARIGLVRTFQNLELFEHLSVVDNIGVSLAPMATPSAAIADTLSPGRSHNEDKEARRALCLVGLDNLADRRPSELSHGQRKLVAVARAIAGAPAVVLLDEPAAGLDTTETEAVAKTLRRLASHGLGVLLIDHDMTLVMSACDRIYVLDQGRVIAHGTPGEVRASTDVVRAYLGHNDAGDAALDAVHASLAGSH